MRVLICDDQAPFRTAAHMVVEMTDGFDMIGEADTGEGAVELAHQLCPDLVLSTYEPEDYAARARAAGAIGYIPKDAFSPEALTAARQEAVCVNASYRRRGSADGDGPFDGPGPRRS